MQPLVTVKKEQAFETWTNAAYAIVGFIILLLASSEKEVFYSFALLTLAVGSGWFHAVLKWPIVVFDFWGMFIVLGVAAGFNIVTLTGATSYSPVVWGPIFLLMAFTGVFMSRWDVFYSVGVYFAAAYIPLLAIWPTSGDLLAFNNIIKPLAAGFFFLLGLIVRQKSLGTKYEHDGHSYWHIITSPGFYFLLA